MVQRFSGSGGLLGAFRGLQGPPGASSRLLEGPGASWGLPGASLGPPGCLGPPGASRSPNWASWGLRGQEVRGSGVDRFSGSAVQWFGGCGVGFSDLRVEGFRGLGVQGFRDLGCRRLAV